MFKHIFLFILYYMTNHIKFYNNGHYFQFTKFNKELMEKYSIPKETKLNSDIYERLLRLPMHSIT